MGRNSVEAYGSKGRADVLQFDPEDVSVYYDSRHSAYKAAMFLPVDIDVSKLEGGTHPLYDPEVHEALEEQRVRNIMVMGVHTPIGVRKNGEKNGKPVIETVFGRRRVLHARAANKRLSDEGKETVRVPATIKRGDEATLMGMWVSENMHRKTGSPIAKAKVLQRYLDYSKSIEEAAVTFDMTTQTVRYYQSLLDCDKSVHKAVEAGQITATLAAQEFSKIPREEQPAALAQLLVASGGTAKGAGAKEKLGNIRGDSNGKKTKTERARPAREIKKAMKTLLKLERQDSKAMVAALKWALGSDNSFSDFKAVDEALFPAESAEA